MNKKKRILGSTLILCLLLITILQTVGPIISYAEEDLRSIDSVEDFLEFAKKCSYDAWSTDKTFTLTTDLSLEGIDFDTIPYFGGNFDGGGHTISGIKINKSISPCGLFGYVAEGAVIKNLNVSGTVSPDGEKNAVGGIVGTNCGKIENCSFSGIVIGKSNVGGIVGINLITGSISDCSSNGEIIGESATGGVVGSNNGLVLSCVSNAEVNTVCVTPNFDISNISISLPLDISKLFEIDSLVMTDAGGIAGYSNGMILGCTNHGDVGYNHVGYNIGGIVGRSSGHLANNKNSATVLGRKDVGGIVGHMEPDISYNLSNDLLASLKAELDALGVLVEDTSISTKDDIKNASEILDNILSLLEKATESLNVITDKGSDFTSDMLVEINRASEILTNVLDQLVDIGEFVPKMADEFSAGFAALEEALNLLAQSGSLGADAFDDFIAAFDNISMAFDEIYAGAELIEEGIRFFDDAIQVNNIEDAKAALDKIGLATKTIGDSLNTISDNISTISKTLEETNALGDEIPDEFLEISTSVSSMANGFTKLINGIDSLIKTIELDYSEIQSGVELIKDGIVEIAESSQNIYDAVSNAKNALSNIQSASIYVTDAVYKLSDAMSEFADGLSLFSNMMEEVNSLISYLASVDPIQVSDPSDLIADEALAMLSALLEVETELKKLNSIITEFSTDTIENVIEIKNKFSTISDTIIEEIYGLGKNKIIDTNIALEEINSITNGRIYKCENLGDIYSDYNGGGIVGAIGIEYALDPEDDLKTELSLHQKRQYLLRAVIHDCTNRGYVMTKYDFAGGISGKMDFGLIYDCKSFCTIESQSGDYVGGISGITAGRIINSYAKCSLSGGKYVGGIIGSGVKETLMGDGSFVIECYSMVEIKSVSQYGGAIAGFDAGEFDGNYFVSSTLSGIDKISYKGKAEPISYDDLVKRKNIPDEFCTFTLTFVADGKKLHSATFIMGDSFDSSIYPEIPKVEGHYSYWDITDLSNLNFDTVVTAVYKPYVLTIGSNECRDDGHKIFLVQGEFTDKDAISLSKNTAANDDLVLKNNLFFKTGSVESWIITIPKDNLDTNKIHYMPQMDGCKIYLKVNNVWVEADSTEFGSYLVFEGEGEEIEIAVVRQTLRILPFAVIGGIVIVGLAILIVLGVKKAKQKRPSPRKAKSQ